MIALLASILSESKTWGQASAGKFVPPDVMSATDISYPPSTTTTGMVSFSVSLNGAGEVKNIGVVQDTPPLTAAARVSVQNWTFRGARVGGTGVASNFPVSVVFNPYNPGGTGVGTRELIPPALVSGGGIDYVAPQISRASYALYPPNTLINGTVVLTVTVDATGHVTKVNVVRGMKVLDAAAVTSVREWAFQPATRSGEAVGGKVCIAFVFQRNLS
jgi:TonB family protein